MCLNINLIPSVVAEQSLINFKPRIRLAQAEDFPAIYEIWMQQHVIQWMSFSKMPQEQFKTLYDQKLSQGCQVYVMEDRNHKIVAVRRIAFSGHTAGFYSMGIDQGHLRKGYASQFYEQFMDLAQNHVPQIKRIEMTQTYSNDAAFSLSDKFGFQVEANFPGWLYRKTEEEGEFYLPERYVYKLLDDRIRGEILNLGMQFETQLPQLNALPEKGYSIKQDGNQFNCYASDGQLLGSCTFQPGVRVISHILFWTVSLEKGVDTAAIIPCLRDLVMRAKQQGFQKIEIASDDPRMLKILSDLGFHYRGEKQASVRAEHGYYNEVCADLGFSSIVDARKLITGLKHLDKEAVGDFSETLEECEKQIQKLLASQEIDAYGGMYLENLVFQIVRENLGSYNLYTRENAPWHHSVKVDELPDSFKHPLKQLISQVEKY